MSTTAADGSPYVIDADAHVVEAGAFLLGVIERFPDDVAIRSDGVPGVLVEGRPYPDITGPGAGCPADRGLTDAEGLDPGSVSGILANADADNIDEMVLYPSFAMCVGSIVDPVLAGGIAQMYNEWIAELCSQSGGRLHAAGVVPLEHPSIAIAELRRAKDLGLVSIVVPPALAERNLDHGDFDAFYAVAVDCDMALGVHGAPGLHLPKIGVDRFTNYVQVHCISFPFDQMTAMTAMVSGGVFDRHPSLRVVYLEAGAGWLPWFIERLGEHFDKRGDWIPGGWKRHPEEYLRSGNLLVTFEAEEAMLGSVVEAVGSGCLMFASDYPHWDGDWPESTKDLTSNEHGLAPEDLAAVAGANARAFYGLAERSRGD